MGLVWAALGASLIVSGAILAALLLIGPELGDNSE